MDTIQVILLAIVQGITEFLPISSSAHLILASELFGWVDQGVWFDLALHAGSLVAVIWYFRLKIISLTGGWLQTFVGKKTSDGNMAWLLILATIPAGIAGILLENLIVDYSRSIVVIAVANIVFAIWLWLADKKGSNTKTMAEITIKVAIIIGLFQAIALIPGTSRSGITITAALMLGFRRDEAASFSFLLAIPLIAAASLFQFVKLLGEQDIPWHSFTIGFLISAVMSYACIALLLKAIRKISMMPFVIYRILLGIILLIIFISG